jgi:hypothetical protein
MEVNSYIPLDIKTVKTVILILKKSLLYNIKLFPPQSHWKCSICITIWPRHIFSKFASMNSILRCVKNLSHTEHMLQTEVTKITLNKSSHGYKIQLFPEKKIKLQFILFLNYINEVWSISHISQMLQMCSL